MAPNTRRRQSLACYSACGHQEIVHPDYRAQAQNLFYETSGCVPRFAAGRMSTVYRMRLLPAFVVPPDAAKDVQTAQIFE